MTLQSTWAERLDKTAEEREHEVRWMAWQAKGALADARMNRRAQIIAAALLGSSVLLLAFELMRVAPLTP